jgi:hypothetical protein
MQSLQFYLSNLKIFYLINITWNYNHVFIQHFTVEFVNAQPN